ncbi:hypothetical protein P5G50_00705 [Leifsonia sp. F6_8S_P_1B]|uniref:Uncharacterized protein n=1 Tax=Leifsonia williamsii TaxID=3035919 RepID=A0ABT8K651_9MICO|nr:hypothetical protein [Leifsonia williamsii]MDN4612955.1 hypothetical protein [Leifsonia williamsii]
MTPLMHGDGVLDGTPGGSATYFLGPVDGRYLVFQVAPNASGARTVEQIATSDKPSIIDYCD